ncbi:larval cuticle protein 65Ag1-like [Ochlerotatus camptorhynchus]|uniref:larval cuticle protein 65Ag1-like n=1 Tax=Ochlerotatus camptorhynchus TaxID=644619 RepID=UPI0031D87068
MKVLIVFALIALVAVSADSQILKYENVADGEGFNFQFVGDDGQEYKVKYVADGQTGFRAEGAHVPNEYVDKLSTL